MLSRRRYRNPRSGRARDRVGCASRATKGGLVSTLEESAWLLRSRINPLPISGALELADGRISFLLDATSGEAQLDWLEERLASDGLRARLQAGERVVVFSHALAECRISWPLTGGGSQMVVEVPGHRWIV